MCTAATYKTKDFYFGRTLDYEFSYGEKITITPRKYVFNFRFIDLIKEHYAIIGMAHIINDYPLYYDACNEMGLCIAGLNFVGNAKFNSLNKNKTNITTFELIPYLLSTCKNVTEACQRLKTINITNTPFNEKFPVSQLHWLISDQNKSITLECTEKGMKIYENKIGVLTNNPSFDVQLFALNNYINLTNKNPTNKFSDNLKLSNYSRGMGAIGLPGDLSSQSRFVRVAFIKEHSISKDDEISSVSQFFHILNSVDQQRGCCEVEPGKYEITIYTSCYSTKKGIYYYTCYDNHQINKIEMCNENLDSNLLITYKLNDKENIFEQN